MRFATAPAAFAAAVAADPARPLITWYDDATGDRAELSGATCANWVAKTANLLVDGGGFGPGDAAVVDAPPHWQTAVVLLGCWAAGLRVAEPGADAEVRFAAADRLAAHPDHADERYGLALAPLAAPMRQVPPGWADFVAAVRAYGDQFTPVSPVEPDDPATTVSHRQLCGAAADRARALGIGPGGRVLVDLAAHPEPLDWLLAPLLAGASTVLCAHLDEAHLAGRIAAERVTTTLTPPPP
jgi:uncharacterized protein (TIGR03089 family)